MINRILCWLFGHRPYFDEIGGAGFQFCERCDMTGECLYDLFAAPVPILISCHNRIEERQGFNLYRAAVGRGDKTVACRYLGSGDTVQIPVKDLNPCHFTK
jgi:hypothetical protein